MPAVSPEILKQVKAHRAPHPGPGGLALRRRVPLGLPGAGDGVRRGARLRAGRRLPRRSTGTSRPGWAAPTSRRSPRSASSRSCCWWTSPGSTRFGEPVTKAALAVEVAAVLALAAAQPERPGGRAAVRRRGRARDPAAEGPPARAPRHSRPGRVRAGGPAHQSGREPLVRQPAAPAPEHRRGPLRLHRRRAGSGRCAAWRRGTRSSRSRWTIRASTSCPSPAGSRCRTRSRASACWWTPGSRDVRARVSELTPRSAARSAAGALGAAGADQVHLATGVPYALPLRRAFAAARPADRPRMMASRPPRSRAVRPGAPPRRSAIRSGSAARWRCRRAPRSAPADWDAPEPIERLGAPARDAARRLGRGRATPSSSGARAR